MHIESAGQRPEISMDQPIIKKLPQITKSPVLQPRLIENTPEHQECCVGTFQLLLNHQESRFFRTIL
jgi:hypothetical protein